MKVLIASHNLGKISEFKEILSTVGFDFLTLNDLADVEEPEEYGLTLNENSLIKAKYYYDLFKLPVIADDTGLFIDDLGGEPGIKAARYSGFGDKENRELVLKKLNGKISNAHFETVLTFYDGTNVITSNGVMLGKITNKEAGTNGFGYDSIFYLPKYDKTVAELCPGIKNTISHRFNAICNLKRKIEFFNDCNKELDYIKSEFLKNLQEEILDIEKIPGGMSNNTFKVTTKNGTYTARIPGINAELFVGRMYELEALNKVKDNFTFVQYNYFDIQSGFKVSPYILKETTDVDYHFIANTLNQMHALPKFNNDFNPFERFLYYERLVNIFDMPLSSKFDVLKNKLFKYRDFLEQRELVACHNDAQLSNHIQTKNGNVLIDFEFTGNNDLLFDFACLGNDDLNIGKEAYKIAVKRQINNEEDKAIELWYSLQALSWYLVAMFKYATGMNQTTGLDFNNIATFFLIKAENLLKKY